MQFSKRNLWRPLSDFSRLHRAFSFVGKQWVSCLASPASGSSLFSTRVQSLSVDLLTPNTRPTSSTMGDRAHPNTREKPQLQGRVEGTTVAREYNAPTHCSNLQWAVRGAETSMPFEAVSPLSRFALPSGSFVTESVTKKYILLSWFQFQVTKSARHCSDVKLTRMSGRRRNDVTKNVTVISVKIVCMEEQSLGDIHMPQSRPRSCASKTTTKCFYFWINEQK